MHIDEKIRKGVLLSAFDKDMGRINNVSYILMLKEDNKSYKLIMRKYRQDEKDILIEEVLKEDKTMLDEMEVEHYFDSIRDKIKDNCK